MRVLTRHRHRRPISAISEESASLACAFLPERALSDRAHRWTRRDPHGCGQASDSKGATAPLRRKVTKSRTCTRGCAYSCVRAYAKSGRSGAEARSSASGSCARADDQVSQGILHCKGVPCRWTGAATRSFTALVIATHRHPLRHPGLDPRSIGRLGAREKIYRVERRDMDPGSSPGGRGERGTGHARAVPNKTGSGIASRRPLRFT